MSDARVFFDAIARRYDRAYALAGDASRARMNRVVAALEGLRRVLVLGVGTGRELPALLDAGHELTGLDVSPEMIALCNKRSRTIPITRADFWDPLPFRAASFDAAIALHGTIAHPPRDDAFAGLASELARVLEGGGVFYAEVPAKHGLARLGPHEGMHLARTSETTFVHTDEAAHVRIEGVALDAAGWRAAFEPALSVTTEPLGDAEWVVAARKTR